MCSIGGNKSYTNRTKKDKTMDQLLERRGDEYSDKQKETMWKVDAAARKDYNAKLAAAYYTSPRFAKDLTLAAANVGLRMGCGRRLVLPLPRCGSQSRKNSRHVMPRTAI